MSAHDPFYRCASIWLRSAVLYARRSTVSLASARRSHKTNSPWCSNPSWLQRVPLVNQDATHVPINSFIHSFTQIHLQCGYSIKWDYAASYFTPQRMYSVCWWSNLSSASAPNSRTASFWLTHAKGILLLRPYRALRYVCYVCFVRYVCYVRYTKWPHWLRFVRDSREK